MQWLYNGVIMRTRSNHLASLIKRRRVDLRISQGKLNIMLGWSSTNGQVISNIERGLQQVPPHSVNKLSFALMVPIEEIINMMVKDYHEVLTMEVMK